jgi:D-beta-D-heptose 7-phosphate kinase/D-beta-D-heptose 1-phosphate adenosyltransferase
MIQEIDIRSHTSELRRHIDAFSKATVLVVGDIIMDKYIWGDVSRISPEAPVPVVEVNQETEMLGGAANVFRNVIALGGKAILCGVVGTDRYGQEIIGRVKDLGYEAKGILAVPDRPTSIKTRIIAHSQQVVRFDRESTKAIPSQNMERLLDFIRECRSELDAIIVADYGKGMISPALMRPLREVVANSGIVIAVDPKTGNFQHYQGVDVITPNHHEAGAFCRTEIKDEASLVEAGRWILTDLNCRSVLITQGQDGMTLFENGGAISHIPTMAKKVFDVTGAGDTVISTFSLGLASGMDMKSAAIISNFAAGIVVGEVGTSTVEAQALKQVIEGIRSKEGEE